ncbi:MAG: rhodanese-like domain-containing protein [Gemmatimonadaceae bacterium]
MEHSPGFLKFAEDARARVHEVTVADALEAVNSQSARLVDVREDNEWNAGHARGAHHLGKGIIERDIEKFAPEKDEPLVLYCGGGYRSAIASDALQRMGYTNVRSMAGGWRAWTEAGAPIEE